MKEFSFTPGYETPLFIGTFTSYNDFVWPIVFPWISYIILEPLLINLTSGTVLKDYAFVADGVFLKAFGGRVNGYLNPFLRAVACISCFQ